MSKRSLRFSAARRERRLARKAAPQNESQQETTTPAAAPDPESLEPEQEPAKPTISEAKLAANRANAQLSTGAKSPAAKAISALNHTIHGLARHRNGVFKLLTTEDPAVFESFKQSLFDEHQPTTETESQLVNGMLEARWLADRAQNLIDEVCLDPDTGAIVDEKKFSLYLRYQTTHTRAFHKGLNDLLRLRFERRKAELGFEAQKLASEKHEMKKAAHTLDIFGKDVARHLEFSKYVEFLYRAAATQPGFEAHLAAEMEKAGLQMNLKEKSIQAAA